MESTLITFGVVAFAILLGFAGLSWFLWMDDLRMAREESETWAEHELWEDVDGLFFKKSA